MLYNTNEVGIRVYHTLSFPIIIDVKRVSRWHHLRCCMVIGAKLCSFVMRLENVKFLDLIYCKKTRDKSVW
jgi:hypothetical protein